MIRAIALLFGIALAASVAAEPGLKAPPPALQQSVQSNLLRHYVARTRACVDVGVTTLLDLGERDADVLSGWALRHCRDAIDYYLRRHLERSGEQTDAYVLALVRAEVEQLSRMRER